jgi:hypothetical protein
MVAFFKYVRPLMRVLPGVAVLEIQLALHELAARGIRDVLQ